MSTGDYILLQNPPQVAATPDNLDHKKFIIHVSQVCASPNSGVNSHTLGGIVRHTPIVIVDAHDWTISEAR